MEISEIMNPLVQLCTDDSAEAQNIAYSFLESASRNQVT